MCLTLQGPRSQALVRVAGPSTRLSPGCSPRWGSFFLYIIIMEGFIPLSYRIYFPSIGMMDILFVPLSCRIYFLSMRIMHVFVPISITMFFLSQGKMDAFFKIFFKMYRHSYVGVVSLYSSSVHYTQCIDSLLLFWINCSNALYNMVHFDWLLRIVCTLSLVYGKLTTST